MAAVIQRTPGFDADLASLRRVPPPRPGFGESDFKLVSRSGFGDGHNSYAHSSAWFEGRLYVGTTNSLWQMNRFQLPRANLQPWPVPPPDDMYDLERRAEIWRWKPPHGEWERVYKAPWVKGVNGKLITSSVGFRGMTVFQGRGDSKPNLYVSTWAPGLTTAPPDILKSEDGVNFHVAPKPPWDAGVRSFRTLQLFNGAVHTSPTGSKAIKGKAAECIGSDATIYACDDIDSGKWEAVCPENFGDKTNLTVFEMATFNGQLYAGTVNATGFQLWRTVDASKKPYTWKRVLHRGGYRGPFNEVGLSLTEFNGALYMGSGIVNGGYHRLYRIGPAAAEILRIWPDDTWDLLVGESRLTPDGLKLPLSGYSAGFDRLFNGYIWRMGVHRGWLYAGTFSWSQLLPYLPRHLWPEDISALVDRWGLDTLVYELGGFELWRTADGVRWENVTRNGFGNPYNWGVRNIISTPLGLAIGTANPYGPEVAMRREDGWRYEPNPRGGCEVHFAFDPA